MASALADMASALAETAAADLGGTVAAALAGTVAESADTVVAPVAVAVHTVVAERRPAPGKVEPQAPTGCPGRSPVTACCRDQGSRRAKGGSTFLGAWARHLLEWDASSGACIHRHDTFFSLSSAVAALARVRRRWRRAQATAPGILPSRFVASSPRRDQSWQPFQECAVLDRNYSGGQVSCTPPRRSPTRPRRPSM
jgi:hypothetical protein